MAVSESYLFFVEEQLGRVAAVRSRRMFGGVGLYADDVFFAVIADDELYLKVDDETREAYIARGMEPFRPYKDARSMEYYQLPAEILEDVDELSVWARDAVEAALRAKRR